MRLTHNCARPGGNHCTGCVADGADREDILQMCCVCGRPVYEAEPEVDAQIGPIDRANNPDWLNRRFNEADADAAGIAAEGALANAYQRQVMRDIERMAGLGGNAAGIENDAVAMRREREAQLRGLGNVGGAGAQPIQQVEFNGARVAFNPTPAQERFYREAILNDRRPARGARLAAIDNWLQGEPVLVEAFIDETPCDDDGSEENQD